MNGRGTDSKQEQAGNGGARKQLGGDKALSSGGADTWGHIRRSMACPIGGFKEKRKPHAAGCQERGGGPFPAPPRHSRETPTHVHVRLTNHPCCPGPGWLLGHGVFSLKTGKVLSELG